jgi:hypothetical protein
MLVDGMMRPRKCLASIICYWRAAVPLSGALETIVSAVTAAYMVALQQQRRRCGSGR